MTRLAYTRAVTLPCGTDALVLTSGTMPAVPPAQVWTFNLSDGFEREPLDNVARATPATPESTKALISACERLGYTLSLAS